MNLDQVKAAIGVIVPFKNFLKIGVVVLVGLAGEAQAAKPETPSKPANVVQKPRVETYQDLVEKARNLTLQRDRLQASQILIRGIRREAKNTVAARELKKALDDLVGLFYTDKAQSLFVSADAIDESKPRETVETLQQALQLEDGNLTILKALARAHLRTPDCAKGEAVVTTAEQVNPFSPEIRLLRLQLLACQKNLEELSQQLAATGLDMEPVDRYLKGFRMAEHLRKKDLKKAKAVMISWEAAAPEYPEVLYWKWELSVAEDAPDRATASKYLQVCQNLSPRKKKNYNLDLELCKGKEKVAEFLKNADLQQSTPLGEDD